MIPIIFIHINSRASLLSARFNRVLGWIMSFFGTWLRAQSSVEDAKCWFHLLLSQSFKGLVEKSSFLTFSYSPCSLIRLLFKCKQHPCVGVRPLILDGMKQLSKPTATLNAYTLLNCSANWYNWYMKRPVTATWAVGQNMLGNNCRREDHLRVVSFFW